MVSDETSTVVPVTPLEWADGCVRLIDQTLLPGEYKILEMHDYREMIEAIRVLRIRGAPAIGVGAAFGIVLGARAFSGSDRPAFEKHVRRVAEELVATRPTAANLGWATERMLCVLKRHPGADVPTLQELLLTEAQRLFDEDRRACEKIGEHGAKLITDGATGITHCNAGALATLGYGTALGVVYAAIAQGKRIRMYADETRPLYQGSRLTAWELSRSGVDVTVISDSTAAYVMQQERIDFAIVGADRIADNGDVANKIGTYSLAVLARHHGIPFYVAAPLSTIDFSLPNGSLIKIEERPAAEVTNSFGHQLAPEGVPVYSPAFDVTPHTLIDALITDRGVVKPPFGSLRKLLLDSPTK